VDNSQSPSRRRGEKGKKKNYLPNKGRGSNARNIAISSRREKRRQKGVPGVNPCGGKKGDKKQWDVVLFLLDQGGASMTRERAWATEQGRRKENKIDQTKGPQNCEIFRLQARVGKAGKGGMVAKGGTKRG